MQALQNVVAPLYLDKSGQLFTAKCPSRRVLTLQPRRLPAKLWVPLQTPQRHQNFPPEKPSVHLAQAKQCTHPQLGFLKQTHFSKKPSA